MKKISWFERSFAFGYPVGMLPFFIERLDGTIARLRQKVSDYPDDVLSDKLEGKWSVKENIAHLAEVGKISDKRIHEIKSGAAVLSPAMLPLTADYNGQSIQEILDFFRQGRKHSIVQYRQLHESDLAETSVHPRLKIPMTAVDLCWFDAEHDDHHLVRINEILKTLEKSGPSSQ